MVRPPRDGIELVTQLEDACLGWGGSDQGSLGCSLATCERQILRNGPSHSIPASRGEKNQRPREGALAVVKVSSATGPGLLLRTSDPWSPHTSSTKAYHMHQEASRSSTDLSVIFCCCG